MSFQDLCKMVLAYATRYECTIAESIEDLDFDGPDGNFGPSEDDIKKLHNHFGIEIDNSLNAATEY
jgi:hypothetical protein